jgi:hypothetical protein
MPGKYPGEESLWCSLENHGEQLMKYPGKSLAMVSCVEEVCPCWADGRCGHLVRVGRHGLM